MIVVGLGNPGKDYALTRHNVGFMVVDALAIRAGAIFMVKREFAFTRVTLGGGPVLVLVKPLLFMNNSGKALAAFAEENWLTPEELLVVHDDMDLPFGRIRIRRRGKSGGHHGIESIINFLGTDGFARLKLGIGRPQPGVDPVEYVLSCFTEPPEQVSAMIDAACRAVMVIAKDGYDKAMALFNGLKVV
ncbi:MAG: aminoacyl-tRNA hydrolase [Bacillota bacterium]